MKPNLEQFSDALPPLLRQCLQGSHRTRRTDRIKCDPRQLDTPIKNTWEHPERPLAGDIPPGHLTPLPGPRALLAALPTRA